MARTKISQNQKRKQIWENRKKWGEFFADYCVDRLQQPQPQRPYIVKVYDAQTNTTEYIDVTEKAIITDVRLVKDGPCYSEWSYIRIGGRL
jgi:hypothetical protein